MKCIGMNFIKKMKFLEENKHKILNLSRDIFTKITLIFYYHFYYLILPASLLRDRHFERHFSGPTHKNLMSIYIILNAYLSYP